MSEFVIGFYHRYIKTNNLQGLTFEFVKLLGFCIACLAIALVGYLFIPQLADLMIERLRHDASMLIFEWILIIVVYLYSLIVYVVLIVALVHYKTIACTISAGGGAILKNGMYLLRILKVKWW